MLKKLFSLVYLITIALPIICMELDNDDAKNNANDIANLRSKESYNEEEVRLFLDYLDAYIIGQDEDEIINLLSDEPKLVSENLPVIFKKIYQAKLQVVIRYMKRKYSINSIDENDSSIVNPRDSKASKKASNKTSNIDIAHLNSARNFRNLSSIPKKVEHSEPHRMFQPNAKHILLLAAGSSIILYLLDWIYRKTTTESKSTEKSDNSIETAFN